jgi:Stage II sporulation protein E (SpoIIE)
MPRNAVLGAALLFLMASLGLAQPSGQYPVQLGESSVVLSGPWRFQVGDNPAWADPGFNDSAWEEVSLAPKRVRTDPMFGGSVYIPGWTAKGHSGYYGYAWYRLRLEVVGPRQGLALEMPLDYDDAYQVYCNGVLVGEAGRFTTSGVSATFSRLHVFPLPPPASDGRMLLAVRMYMRPDTALTYPEVGGMHAPPILGLEQALRSAPRTAANVLLRIAMFDIPTLLLCFFVALIAVGFFLLDRSEGAYLWLAAATLTLGLLSALDLTTYLASNLALNSAVLFETAALLPLSYLFWFFFWTSWFRLGRERGLRELGCAGAVMMALLSVLVSSPVYGSLVPVKAIFALRPLQNGVTSAFGLLLLWVAYRGIRRYGTDGWLALGPIALLSISLFRYQLQSTGIPVNYFPHGIRITLYDITAVLSLLATSILLLRRFRAGQRERERIAGEFKAAHTLQSLVLAGEQVEAPQFKIETVYQPAQEVGGDFFQVLPAPAGGLLVVVGDVSGKGLRAAMTVSTIIGALRREDSRQPRTVLSELNRVLKGQRAEGFTTCLCALMEASGKVTLANAGHIPPYCNGAEVPIYGGLPLGLNLDLDYVEVHYQMTPGDQLTFVSDGVVEARDRSGALFGFERTRDISSQSASAIVAAAKEFGQQDDITVLTVSFVAKPVAASA